MQDYRKLLVWQKAHKLAVKTYELPAYLRAPEGWVMRDQILGAAISIPSNIAEGAGRGSNPDFCRFLWYSNGSCNELENDLLIARDASLIPGGVHDEMADRVSEVRRMLTSLIQNMERPSGGTRS